MGNERRATIYHNLWNQIKMGEYESSDISIAIDNKCFLTILLESNSHNSCDYLEKVYENLAQKIFKIDPTIKVREVAFAKNFDDIWIEYASDQFNQRLEIIFKNKLVELQQKTVRDYPRVLEKVIEGTR